MASEKNSLPTLYKEIEVAKHLDLSLSGLRKYRRQGLINFIKVKRKVYHTPQHVQEFLDRFSSNGGKMPDI